MNTPALVKTALGPHKAFAAAFVLGCLSSFALFGAKGWLISLLFAPPFAGLILKNSKEPRESTNVIDPSAEIHRILERFLEQTEHPTTALVVEVDNHLTLEEIYGREALLPMLDYLHGVLDENLTADDVTVQSEAGRFISALAPNAPLTSEAMLNLCTRIQHSLSNAPRSAALPVQLSASISFASSNKLACPTAETLLSAALCALAEAKRRAPNAVRGYSDAIARRQLAQRQTARDAAKAFERGEFFAYFQPQIDLVSGRLSGFEALTRWHHPTKGIMSPVDFLPSLEQAGLMPRLGETMIRQALQALTFWDKAGLQVPRVGVNLSVSELRNPRLVEQISTHLEVGKIEPKRLTIEVLETVVATEGDEDVIGNLAALADLGCGIDLDDFGTGYASIANIRKFSVKRIKIDRSFVSGIDVDDEQRKMVSAMLTMAERLGVQALAEGVETRGEEITLREIGCHDAQGFMIARPMPIQETVEWAHAFFTQSVEPLHFIRHAG